MNYLTLFPQETTWPSGQEVPAIQGTDWGTMFLFRNMPTGGFGGNGTLTASLYSGSDYLTALFQPGIPTTFPTTSTAIAVPAVSGGITPPPPASTPPPVVATTTTTIPFVNNCPAGVVPSGGWDIRGGTASYSISVSNFLKAYLDKPIVLSVNVPKGYTTV